jgi:GWxTD domain-containing protein
VRIVVIILAVVCALPVFAQTQNAQIQTRSIFVDVGEKLYAEAIVLPTERVDSAGVAVFFRISHAMLSFTRVLEGDEVRGNFSAPVTVSIEVRDSIGVVRKRIAFKDTAFVNTFEQTNDRTLFRYGWRLVTIPPGKFDLTLETQSAKESTQRRLALPPVVFTPSSHTTLTRPFFVEEIKQQDSIYITPFVFGGNVPFRSQDAIALMFVPDKNGRNYSYSLRQLPSDAKDVRWWDVTDVAGDVRSKPGLVPSLSSRSERMRPLLSMTQVKPFSDVARMMGSVASLRIPIPISSMVPGRYQLDVVREDGTDTISATFRVYWEQMPLSLRNLDYAIELMQYIMTEEEHDELDGGPASDRRFKLMQYWRTHDPTPATTFNEHLQEYFRRVDQAFYAFSTIQEPDGAQTDRGKVYILHGPPTQTEKRLDQQRPVEIWTYSNSVGQTFTFEIDEKGLYRLVEVKSR